MCQLFACVLVSSFLVGFSYSEPQCQRINKTISDLHMQCGYNLTARFDYEQHFNSASRAILSLKSVLKNCSAFVDVMTCSLFLPRCTEDIKGPFLPCRGVCHDYANECKDIIYRRGLEWTVAMCDILPEKDNPQTTKGYRERCFTPPNYRDSGKTYKHNCSDIVIEACQGIPGYTKTVVSESTQRTYHNYIDSQIKYNANDTCSPLRKEIVCAENLPACVDGTTAFLCRDNCLSFFSKCKSPFFYGSDMCMEFPKREGTRKESLICKQTHWPRAENWQLPAENTTTPSPTAGVSTTQEAGITTGISMTQGPRVTTGDSVIQGGGVKTDEVPSPVPGIRGHQKGKKTGSKKLLVGLVVTFISVLLVGLAVVGFIWYRRKKRHQFDYQKQVLYCEDKAEEFEIFT